MATRETTSSVTVGRRPTPKTSTASLNSSTKIAHKLSSWRACSICTNKTEFKGPREFCRHLRDFHCSKEGGSFVCQYGANGVCSTLPVEGVNDRDYVEHVMREHARIDPG